MKVWGATFESKSPCHQDVGAGSRPHVLAELRRPVDPALKLTRLCDMTDFRSLEVRYLFVALQTGNRGFVGACRDASYQSRDHLRNKRRQTSEPANVDNGSLLVAVIISGSFLSSLVFLGRSLRRCSLEGGLSASRVGKWGSSWGKLDR